MKVGLVIEILAVTLAFGAVVGGVFGMNLVNNLEQSPLAFTFILVGMCLLMVFIFGGFLFPMIPSTVMCSFLKFSLVIPSVVFYNQIRF